MAGGGDPKTAVGDGGIEALRASEARFRFLSELGEATRETTDPERIMGIVARELGRHMGASRCAYAEVEPDGERFTIRHDYTEPGVASTVGEYVLSLFGARAAEDMRSGRTLIVRDVERELPPEDGGGMFLAIGIRAIVCCPLVKGGRLTAMMAVHHAAPRRWTADEVALVEAVVEQSWAHIERARAARELSRSESELRLLADAVPQLVWTARGDGTVDYFNHQWYEYTGLPPRGLGGEDWSRVVHPDDLDRVVAAWVASVRTGEPYELEIRLRRVDGAYRWFLARALPLKDGAGEVVRWFGTSTDIHAWKEAERRAREDSDAVETINRVGQAVAAELDLQRLVQTITDETTALTHAKFGAFFYNVVDEHGKSYALYTLSGVPREAFSRFPMPRNTEVFGPTFAGQGVVRLADVTKDPRYGRNAPYNGMPEGHLPVRSYLAVSVVSRTGEVLGGLFFGHPDVGVFTERDERVVVGIAAQAAVAIDNARLYDALRASRARAEAGLGQLRAIVASMVEGLIVSDSGGNLLEWNRAALEMHGYASVDEVRRNLATFRETFDLIPAAGGAPLPLDRWPMARALAGEAFTGYELIVKRKDIGLDLVVAYSGAPVRNADGRVSLAILTLHDVTDRKRAERERDRLLASERAARAEAEKASRTKDEFLATLSHELRTPLNAIYGWAQILRTAPPNAADLAEGLEVIERNARAQTKIIDDLLDMSRIVSGKVRLDVQRLDLADVVRAAVETVRPAADAKEIRLQAVLDPLARPVTGDPGRLQQVFWNLLSNAIKFTPKGGRVQVVLERVNSHLEVSVTDTGEGIAPEFLPHVFERFVQADGSTTRRHGGLGLGLAIVKQLVELHGGTVRAKSGGAGRGATFSVSLPLTVAEPEPNDPGRRHPTATPTAGERLAGLDAGVRLNGVHVLVVDDEADARQLVAKLLEAREARVTSAASAGEALEKMSADRPDVLVSDIGMPGEDGYSLIQRVRALGSERGGDVPAIALTAYARAEDRVKAVRAGFRMHVAKPVEPAELVAMVASLAGRVG